MTQRLTGPAGCLLTHDAIAAGDTVQRIENGPEYPEAYTDCLAWNPAHHILAFSGNSCYKEEKSITSEAQGMPAYQRKVDGDIGLFAPAR